jgi:tetratricopeptide (TPR) repeat protein
LSSVNILAGVLQHQGKYAEAETLNRRALEGSEKELGLQHPDTLSSIYCLAYLLHKMKRHQEASQLYQTACDGFKKKLGPEHPTTIVCCRNYSNLQKEMAAETLP